MRYLNVIFATKFSCSVNRQGNLTSKHKNLISMQLKFNSIDSTSRSGHLEWVQTALWQLRNAIILFNLMGVSSSLSYRAKFHRFSLHTEGGCIEVLWPSLGIDKCRKLLRKFPFLPNIYQNLQNTKTVDVMDSRNL